MKTEMKTIKNKRTYIDLYYIKDDLWNAWKKLYDLDIDTYHGKNKIVEAMNCVYELMEKYKP